MRKTIIIFLSTILLLTSFTFPVSAAGTQNKKPISVPTKNVKESDFKPTINPSPKVDENETKVLAEYIYQTQVTLDREMATRIATSLLQNASKYYISYELLVGMAEVESKFRPWAISEKGAKGLMQIMFKIHKNTLERILNTKLQERDLFRVEVSVEAACIILQMYGIIDTPETAIGKYFGQSKDTNGYVAKVFYATGKYVAYRQKIRRQLFEKVVKK